MGAKMMNGYIINKSIMICLQKNLDFFMGMIEKHVNYNPKFLLLLRKSHECLP